MTQEDEPSGDDHMDFGYGFLLLGLRQAYKAIKYLLTKKSIERQQRFAEAYQPLFDEFIVINRDYLAMFNQLDYALTGVIIGHIDASALPVIKQQFSDRRLEYLGERTKLRAEAQAVLQAASDPFEQRFLYSLLCYFLEHETPYKEPPQMSVAIETLLNQGVGAVFGTPSFVMLQQLGTETDPAKMQQVVQKKRADLAGYFATVTNMFVELKRDVKKI